MNEWLVRARDALAYAPEHTGWIYKWEVPQAPWAILRRLNPDAKFPDDARVEDVLIPVVNANDQQMHHEIGSVFRNVEFLKEKAGVAVADICKVFR